MSGSVGRTMIMGALSDYPFWLQGLFMLGWVVVSFVIVMVAAGWYLRPARRRVEEVERQLKERGLET